ncbi:HTH-type transcriptional repressor AcnR [Ruegeria sp. THAF57]|uniref:TetR/AcrR family transcriptional regulator n=1 Tax=Ruegeria sp. THAF57 TaxID=2744555 RepID=UPI0015DD6E57|nr:TetR/AcrR family transcriptional regulator [Ruegeria sp. THAF57]CAD0186713.1 HTH-type transcriptional repressor AcnR [Ruegeria sp. THAF57]
MPESATILRTGRKFDQVVRGAREVFMADGFEGASVDDIARAAGVSKATLYSYFPDKRLLFMEVAHTECSRMAENVLSMIDDSKPVREVLTVAATQLSTFLVSEFAQQVFRICVAERDRFPELGQAFYEAGPQNGVRHLVEYFRKAVNQGELAIDDLQIAAEQFSELCKVRIWARAAFGIQNSFSQSEIDEVARQAVDLFMTRYAV